MRVRVLCARLFRIQPALEALGPDLDVMLARCDAALIIGDNALFLEPRHFLLNLSLCASSPRVFVLARVFTCWRGAASVGGKTGT